MILIGGQRVPARRSFSTVLPGIDFETYSEAGYVWSDEGFKWISAGPSKTVSGLPLVGVGVYAAHPSTEVLCLSYDLKDGKGVRRWNPSLLAPSDLLHHVECGYPIQAWNSLFEYMIWNWVAVPKLGWPPLKLTQLHDAMAKARASSMPGKLANASKLVGISLKDTAKGTRVLNRFSKPRNPTKNDYRVRLDPLFDPQGEDLFDYCDQDVEAEGNTALAFPDLSDFERQVWLFDQRVNIRGCHVDMPVVLACRTILTESAKRHDRELYEITGGDVARSSEVSALTSWLAGKSVYMDSLDEEAVSSALKNSMDPAARRALEIRSATASAGAKKVESLYQQTAPDGQLRGLFMYHAAHTGRWASGGVQLHNMVSGGPALMKCEPCGAHYYDPEGVGNCPRCGSASMWNTQVEWGYGSMMFALSVFRSGDYDLAEVYFKDRVVHVIASCVRGMLIARPGYELIGSDYSAIEAVVLAMLAGEAWRIEVFRTHGKIYEMCVTKITGVPFQELLDYKKTNNSHHPHRKPFGKVPELASGYQGWIGAWKNFGADEFMDDDEIKKNILKWRGESPMIVELWGGQYRKDPHAWEFTPELYGLEGAFIAAVLNPGKEMRYRYITYLYEGGNVYCILPSGRAITYNNVRLGEQVNRFHGGVEYQIFYWCWNSNPKKGPMGWTEVSTYGGSLTENVTQAVARDIFAHGALVAESKGYEVVLHTHDELTAEVPVGFGSIEEFEACMMTLPDWCKDWPIRAAGGWRGREYRKD